MRVLRPEDGVPGPDVARFVRLSKRLLDLLERGIRLRGVRIEEGYTRLPGGHYEVEHRFVVSTRLHLGPTDEPSAFQGYLLSTTPRNTEGYEAWTRRVMEGLA